MKRAKLISAILCAAMLLALCAGCAGSGGNGDTTTAAPGTTSSAAGQNDGTTTAPVQKIDLNKYEFVLGGADREWRENPTNQLEEDMMDQYAQIEDLYNCTITCIGVGDPSETLITAGISGDNLADFIRCKQNAWAPAALKKIIRPLETEEILATGLNVNDENQVDLIYTKLSTFEGHVWTVSFSGEYFVPFFGHSYFFNKKLVAQAGYTDKQMYEAVRNWSWNYDMFKEICREVSADTNMDGTYDIEGLSMADWEAELMSNKIGLLYVNSDGKWHTGFDTPEFAVALNFLLEIVFDPDITMADRAGLNNDGRRQTFYDGKAAFGCLYGANFGAEGCNNRMVDDYGMLPIPHGPDAEFYPHTIPDLHGYVLQYNNKDWETSCFIMSEIGNRMTDPEKAAETYKSYFRDEESYEMLTEYCFKNAKIQSSRFSPQIDGTLDIIAELMMTKGVAAATEQAAQIMQSAINDLFGY